MINKKAIFPISLILLGLAVLIINLNTYMKPEPKNPQLAEGMKAPKFEVKDIKNNNAVSLDSLTGKVIFINFWASWCKPCRDEMPSINNLYKIMSKNSNFKMITIIYNENPSLSVNYLKKSGFDIPVYYDPNGISASNYGLTGVPETYIINKSGILSKIRIGPDHWDSKENFNFISGLLN